MRIMIVSENSSERENLIAFFSDKYMATVDFFDEYDLAEYCIDTRYYEYVFVEHSDKHFHHVVNIAGTMKKNGQKLVVFGDYPEKDFPKKIAYASYGGEILSTPSFSTKEAEQFMDKEKPFEIDLPNIKINTKTKEIFVIHNGEKVQIEFKRMLDYQVFVYFARHHDEVISISRLLDATQEEPELEKNVTIELSIAAIRKLLGGSSIKSYKKKGYLFSAPGA